MISEKRVEAIMLDCLFLPSEMPESGAAPEGAISVRGLTSTFGLHPARLESHRSEVACMLDQLPSEFHKSGGGGWSFLNACQTRDGETWTGLHRSMEQLVVLGIGLGLAQYLMPREMWAALPGGMPYFLVDTSAAVPTPA